MKITLAILALTFATLTAVHAQAPLAVNPAQSTGPQALNMTSDQRANVAVAQLEQQVNRLFTQIVTIRTAGLPAQGNLPAVTPAQIDSAFGAANVAKLVAAAGVLLPAASPTPTP